MQRLGEQGFLSYVAGAGSDAWGAVSHFYPRIIRRKRRGREMGLEMKGSGPRYGEGSLNNRNSPSFLLGHHVLLRSPGNPFTKVQPQRRQGEVFER